MAEDITSEGLLETFEYFWKMPQIFQAEIEEKLQFSLISKLAEIKELHIRELKKYEEDMDRELAKRDAQVGFL